MLLRLTSERNQQEKKRFRNRNVWIIIAFCRTVSRCQFIHTRNSTNTTLTPYSCSLNTASGLPLMSPQRLDQHLCFAHANSITASSSSAPSHRLLRLLPRRSHAKPIALSAKCAPGSLSGPAAEEDDEGGCLFCKKDPTFT